MGGQLGIAKDDLLEFTKAIDVASQALSNDFTGGAEEIATVLGKLSTAYRRELGPDVAQTSWPSARPSTSSGPTGRPS